ncbi:hypothetical protein HPB50_019981 [Hyalomma asiaticum]|uniref:Uncharacterized protein n=1 Tax=Hyalomma asiaticum TaxID=266040 RepID=A0ACB7T8Q2_HYAAI|nr:hypothetical protein HPB50_019981 [Hyalomma asiaticum]
MLRASVRQQDEEDGWIPVSYRRKQQNRATVAPTPSSGSPRKYQHTVILRPKHPCRIMDEPFIRLDQVITRHISAHLNLSEEDSLPEFTVRYLGHSNQLAVDAAEPEVRNALLAIASLPISGKDVPFQAYEAVGQNQIRGIIRNAGDMTSEELMNSLHCRKCKILQARPLGDKGTAMVTFEVAVCNICRKIGHHKEQCPNTSAARCPTCGLRQHEEGTECLNAEPKCRSCGGSHLATATKCPKRREVNKKIEQKRNPAAKRQRKKRQVQGHQHRNAETERGFSRPIIKPTRQSFYTGPPAPSAAHLPRVEGRSILERTQLSLTGLPPLNDHQHLPAPTSLEDLERRLENCMAEIEKSIYEKVEQLISRAIEKCVHTIMERIMLSGMLPLGTTSPTTAGAQGMTRLRALATINRGPWPSSLRTWACPDPTPPDRAIEFWRALLMFLQDPAAPPVGDRLRDSHKIQAAPT